MKVVAGLSVSGDAVSSSIQNWFGYRESCDGEALYEPLHLALQGGWI